MIRTSPEDPPLITEFGLNTFGKVATGTDGDHRTYAEVVGNGAD